MPKQQHLTIVVDTSDVSGFIEAYKANLQAVLEREDAYIIDRDGFLEMSGDALAMTLKGRLKT